MMVGVELTTGGSDRAQGLFEMRENYVRDEVRLFIKFLLSTSSSYVILFLPSVAHVVSVMGKYSPIYVCSGLLLWSAWFALRWALWRRWWLARLVVRAARG